MSSHWRVVVNRPRKEVYYFATRDLVVASIETTWSARPDTIKVAESGNQNKIVVFDRDNFEILLTAVLVDAPFIRTRAEHF